MLAVREATTAEQLAPGLPGFETERLWRPAGGSAFGWALPATPLAPGDALVVYRLREGSAEDIVAVNAIFSGRFYAGGSSGAPRTPWPDEVALIEAEVPERAVRVLEICCGAGRVTPHLRRAGNEVVGLDVVPACVAAACRAAPEGVRYVAGDARALPFPDASFDLALCLENSLGVLAGSEVRVLAELARVCRPGGRVLLGARSLPAPSLERYASDDGYLELARVLPEAWTALLLRRVERGGRVRLLPRPEARGVRPWGGQVGYWALQRVG